MALEGFFVEGDLGVILAGAEVALGICEVRYLSLIGFIINPISIVMAGVISDLIKENLILLKALV